MFGETSSLDFQFIRTEKPDCISFHTLTLLPHWFVNVDMRKFDFTNVEWHGSLNQEIENLKINKVSPPHRLLAIACRHLQSTPKRTIVTKKHLNSVTGQWTRDAEKGGGGLPFGDLVGGIGRQAATESEFYVRFWCCLGYG